MWMLRLTRCKVLFCLSFALVCCARLAGADVAPESAELAAFVADLEDPDLERHQSLSRKQAAVHQWLIRDCMQERGFKDEASSNKDDWHAALHGEFAYCQDHHIPGIDPPCPAAAVVEASVEESCYGTTARLIDRSSDIMHDARGRTPAVDNVDPSNMQLQNLDAEWSDCMQAAGFDQYPTRVSMHRSFGEAAGMTSEQRAALPDQARVLAANRKCMQNTRYVEQQSEIINALKAAHYAARQSVLAATLERYNEAEYLVEEQLKQFCAIDDETITAFYQQNRSIIIDSDNRATLQPAFPPICRDN